MAFLKRSVVATSCGEDPCAVNRSSRAGDCFYPLADGSTSGGFSMACNDKLQSCNDFLKNISLLLSDVLGCAQRILPSAPVSRLPAPSPYAPDAQIPITKPRYAGTSKIYHPNGTAAHRADTSATPAFCLLSIRDIPASHANISQRSRNSVQPPHAVELRASVSCS